MLSITIYRSEARGKVSKAPLGAATIALSPLTPSACNRSPAITANVNTTMKRLLSHKRAQRSDNWQ